MGQRISFGVCVLRHLIKLPCTGVNQLVQFPFCLNENVHLTRHDVAFTPPVHRCQNRKEQISSANLGLDYKLGRLNKNREMKELRKQTTHTHIHSIWFFEFFLASEIPSRTFVTS